MSNIFSFQDPKILDSSSNSEDIIQYLDGLLQKMETLNDLAATYKSYQKNFKVIIPSWSSEEKVYIIREI